MHDKWIFVEAEGHFWFGDFYDRGIPEAIFLEDWKERNLEIGEWYRIPDPEEVCEFPFKEKEGQENG